MPTKVFNYYNVFANGITNYPLTSAREITIHNSTSKSLTFIFKKVNKAWPFGTYQQCIGA